MFTVPFQPIQPIAKSLTDGKFKGPGTPEMPFANYFKQEFFGMIDGLFDYGEGYYKLAAGQVNNLHNVTVTAYQGALLAKILGAVASTGIKGLSSFMQINI